MNKNSKTKKMSAKNLPADHFIPFSKAGHRDIVGFLKIPIRASMLKGWDSGSIAMAWADTGMTLTEGNDKTKIGYLGGTMGGGFEYTIGKNHFSTNGRDFINAFFAWLNEHPEYRDYKDGNISLELGGE